MKIIIFISAQYKSIIIIITIIISVIAMNVICFKLLLDFLLKSKIKQKSSKQTQNVL